MTHQLIDELTDDDKLVALLDVRGAPRIPDTGAS
jgi:hypothetical protein